MRRRRIQAMLILSLMAGCLSARAAETADDLLDRIGVRRGVCVVLGDASGELSLALAKGSELLVYAQLAGSADVQQVRRAAAEAGLYGRRLYVARGDAAHIHLADNLADALVAVGEGTKVAEAEALRVLRPGARAVVGQKVIVKPAPAGADDWTHPLHGPSNNRLSNDRLARAPYLSQFLAEPYYAAAPQAAVCSGGRLFLASGHVAFHRRSEPMLNTLYAVNAYNGTPLWTRPLTPGLMVDRNTIIATPDTLYLADDTSCKLIDAATGAALGEIAVPEKLAGGTFWKWMALQDGVLYAMVGEKEFVDKISRWRRRAHGWAWDNVSPGYHRVEYAWGMGRNLFAIDLETKKVLWHHREAAPADSRALCLEAGRLFLFCPGGGLTCLDTRTGKEAWRQTGAAAEAVLEAVGEFGKRAGSPNSGWHSARYLRSYDGVLYFAGPPIKTLVAVSAEDGKMLWSKRDPWGYQILVRHDAVYAFAGQADQTGNWRLRQGARFERRTGRPLGPLPGRRACVPATGTADSVLCRAMGGTLRYDVATQKATYLNPMRPSCFGGVIVAHGLLYWTPWQCDCNLQVFGLIANAPAGGFDFTRKATDAERLETPAEAPAPAPFDIADKDWPTLRADNQRTCQTRVAIPAKADLLWTWKPRAAFMPTAPVAAGGMVVLAGDDGVVRALDAAEGTLRWTAFTGGRVFYPPTLWAGRALVGSGDGNVYALEAASGRRLWRFRAAPIERRIPVFGKLMSTWPAASGVLVEKGTAYVAAGTFDFNGTYVFALDAATGTIRWENNTSGRLDPDSPVGVNVQGHLLTHQGRLYLAGGTLIPAAPYDLATGRFLGRVRPRGRGSPGARAGSELILLPPHPGFPQGSVGPAGQRLYQRRGHITYSYWPQFLLFALHIEGPRKFVAWSGAQSAYVGVFGGDYDIRRSGVRRGQEQAVWLHRCDTPDALADRPRQQADQVVRRPVELLVQRPVRHVAA